MSHFPYKLTVAGERMAKLTGVRAIMRDISDSLRNPPPDLCNLSAGNPLIIPEVAAMWRRLGDEILKSAEFDSIVGRYGSTQGYDPLIDAVCQLMEQRYGQKISRGQVLVTSGTQALYFYAANALAGQATATHGGGKQYLLLPLCPDYTGYGGISIDPTAVVSKQPSIELLSDPHLFRYRPSITEIDENVGAILFSRPSNPTGNVMTDADVAALQAKAAKRNVIMFVDGAYGPPFPNITPVSIAPVFAENVVHGFSLSKAGLPGERVGIAIGPEQLMRDLEAFESNATLHSSRFGQALVAKAITSGELERLSSTVIAPTYLKKHQILEAALRQYMPKSFRWRLHAGEGGLFGWLWLEDLTITDYELYNRLKARGVLVVPGTPFFVGLPGTWQHSSQCLRISLTAPDNQIEQGMARLAQLVQ